MIRFVQRPHRLAPLSEGRITDNSCLECPYRGWAFTETGNCDRIPFQAENDTAQKKPGFSFLTASHPLPTFIRCPLEPSKVVIYP